MQRRKTGDNFEPDMEEEDESSTNGGHLEYRHRAQSFIDSKALDELETEVFETGLYENVDVSRGSRYGVMAAEIVYSKSIMTIITHQKFCSCPQAIFGGV